MYCLYCGDCCKRMSPLSVNGGACAHIVERGTFVFCGRYNRRPAECVRHEFHARVCPVGLDVLGLAGAGSDVLRKRIDDGWAMICGGVAMGR